MVAGQPLRDPVQADERGVPDGAAVVVEDRHGVLSWAPWRPSDVEVRHARGFLDAAGEVLERDPVERRRRGRAPPPSTAGEVRARWPRAAARAAGAAGPGGPRAPRAPRRRGPRRRRRCATGGAGEPVAAARAALALHQPARRSCPRTASRNLAGAPVRRATSEVRASCEGDAWSARSRAARRAYSDLRLKRIAIAYKADRITTIANAERQLPGRDFENPQ